jgi:hypothetical protein
VFWDWVSNLISQQGDDLLLSTQIGQQAVALFKCIFNSIVPQAVAYFYEIRFIITFTIISLSCGLLWAIISVKATRVSSLIIFFP